jgi:hypothetical protein
LLLAAPARAESPPFHLSYSAPAGCGTREGFIAELTTRSARVRVAEPAADGPTLEVTLADRATGVIGELRFRELDGAETLRAVPGKSCEEVIPALALIAAVLIDPEAASRLPPALAPGPASSPATAAAPALPAKGQALRLHPTLGAGAAFSSVLAPNLSYAPSFELGLETTLGGRRGPALSLAVERFASSAVSTSAGSADFSTLLGRLTLCPWQHPQKGIFFVAPCGAFEAGSLHVSVADTSNEQEPTVLWLAVGPAVHLEVRLLPFLGLGLDVLGIFPLVRDHFYFAPDHPVFSVPVFGWTGRLGLKAILP